MPSIGEIARALEAGGGLGAAPVERWNPPYCGEIDMRIAYDGTWFYGGSPIGRPELVRLFASVLVREDGRYFLVTPAEKCAITVDDAPFLAVDMRVAGSDDAPLLEFRTNLGEWIACDADHRLRFAAEDKGGLRPYLHVRRGLEARALRPVYYDLVGRAEERVIDGQAVLGVSSGGVFFTMARADRLEDLA